MYYVDLNRDRSSLYLFLQCKKIMELKKWCQFEILESQCLQKKIGDSFCFSIHGRKLGYQIFQDLNNFLQSQEKNIISAKNMTLNSKCSL